MHEIQEINGSNRQSPVHDRDEILSRIAHYEELGSWYVYRLRGQGTRRHRVKDA
jgi:hypothetical protein